MWKEANAYRGLAGKTKRDNLQDTSLDGWIILRWNFNKWDLME